ncbi:4'-phosphopantetheinyl transferase superfamily protein (plasmid) [Bacillus tropicus]|uniref:4'-phosphopantetheinyl transferase family protein n=1 Tax=Bacillus tropicus TaxID=2026188 RepID=UPI0020057973|nr:4'-phosphopantetheinyl transferase superfamily protein [Bacillus tropicus]UOK49130.1 4'-phosphopantetheinyl transferase superfamily protein [Bacillus tropicus]
MNLYIVEVPKKLSNEEFQYYLKKASTERQAKIKHYVRQEDSIRTLFGELLIRAIIKRERGITSKGLFLSYNKYGKPYFRDVPNFHFNISHSGKWLVCATDNNPIGIDIELIKPIDLRIAERFFTTEEYQHLKKQHEYNQLSCFYDFWTLKEAFVKAIGKGLIVPLNSFSFSIKKTKEFVLNCNFMSHSFWFKQYEIDPQYRLSVCSMGGNAESGIIQIPYNDLVSPSITF